MVKIKPFKMIRFFLILVIIVYFGAKVFINAFLKETSTYELTYDQINIERDYKGIIFRNETIVYSNSSGSIQYYVNEGEKVKKGQRIAEISFASDIVDEAVDTEQKQVVASEIIADNIKDINDSLDEILEQSVVAIKNGEYVKSEKLKQDLMLKIQKRNRLVANKSLISNQSSFSQQFVGSGSLREGESLSLYSPYSGMVTFNMDKLEEDFTIEDIYNIDYSSIMDKTINEESLLDNVVHKNSPVYKLIDPATWFIVCVIDKDEINLYQKDKAVVVEIDDELLNGVIADVFESGEKGALVIKFTEQFSDVYKKRKLDIKVRRDNFQGIKVKKDSIISVNGQNGVMILGIDNKATFVPIQIIGYNEEDAVVQDGFFYVGSGEERQRIKTLESYNEVLIHPERYKEGEKVY